MLCEDRSRTWTIFGFNTRVSGKMPVRVRLFWERLIITRFLNLTRNLSGMQHVTQEFESIIYSNPNGSWNMEVELMNSCLVSDRFKRVNISKDEKGEKEIEPSRSESLRSSWVTRPWVHVTPCHLHGELVSCQLERTPSGSSSIMFLNSIRASESVLMADDDL